MRIAVGSDHAGYLLKEFLATHLAQGRHDQRIREIAVLDAR